MIYCFILEFFIFFDFIHGILRQTAILVIIISIYILVYIAYTDYTVYALQHGWLIKITEGHQSSICWQQTSHMERSIFLITITNQVR